MTRDPTLFIRCETDSLSEVSLSCDQNGRLRFDAQCRAHIIFSHVGAKKKGPPRMLQIVRYIFEEEEGRRTGKRKYHTARSDGMPERGGKKIQERSVRLKRKEG